jgi:hypothetical protein
MVIHPYTSSSKPCQANMRAMPTGLKKQLQAFTFGLFLAALRECFCTTYKVAHCLPLVGPDEVVELVCILLESVLQEPANTELWNPDIRLWNAAQDVSSTLSLTSLRASYNGGFGAWVRRWVCMCVGSPTAMSEVCA